MKQLEIKFIFKVLVLMENNYISYSEYLEGLLSKKFEKCQNILLTEKYGML